MSAACQSSMVPALTDRRRSLTWWTPPWRSALTPRLVEFSQVTSQELQNLVRRGESEQLEFKQSSAQFPRAGETLCAFMNGRGGQVLVGVRPDGSVAGQTIADRTLQELAQVLRRFDPPIPVEIERIPAETDGLEVLVLVPRQQLIACRVPTMGDRISGLGRPPR